MSLIRVTALEKSYGADSARTVALAGVTLSIQRGEFVAVMGPSGSGKSTLLHMLGLLDRPTSGEYLFDGKRATEYSDTELARLRNHKMGFVFQAFHLLPRTTVLENVMLPLTYSVVPESEWNGRAERALASVGLDARMYHLPSELSGGEKQRTAIARALVMSPEVVFADEPTGNLDSRSGEAVMEILERLQRDDHITVILITHDRGMAAHAERVVHLKDGRVEREEHLEQRALHSK